MPVFKLPMGRVPLGIAYLSLFAAGLLSFVFPNEAIESAVGWLVYLWGILYIIGGGISGIGIVLRSYLFEWPGLVFLIGANSTLVVAILNLFVQTGGSFITGFVLCLTTSLTALLAFRLMDNLSVLRRVDRLNSHEGGTNA